MSDPKASPHLDEKKQDETSIDTSFHHVEDASSVPSSPVDDEGDNELLGEKRAAAERHLVRKLDARLLPTICAPSLLSLFTSLNSSHSPRVHPQLH